MEATILDLECRATEVFVHPAPEARIEQRALEINGYTREKWEAKENLVTRVTAASRIYEATEEKVLVGCNVTFDHSFMYNFILKNHLRRPKWFYKPLDLPSFAYAHVNGLGPLNWLGKVLDVAMVPDHSSYKDARVARDIYVTIMNHRLDQGYVPFANEGAFNSLPLLEPYMVREDKKRLAEVSPFDGVGPKP